MPRSLGKFSTDEVKAGEAYQADIQSCVKDYRAGSAAQSHAKYELARKLAEVAESGSYKELYPRSCLHTTESSDVKPEGT